MTGSDMTPQPAARYRTATMEDARKAVQALLETARYQVDILSPLLDHQLYDQAPVINALRRVVVEGGRHSRIRILVADPGPVVQRSHRLVHLARKLSTFMEIRHLGNDDRIDPPSWLSVDTESCARWEPNAGYEGVVGPGCRGDARRMERAFNELWNRSSSDPSLRRLHI